MNTDLMHRMKSIRQTVQISGAQKLVASAHIGKARKALQESEPYHARVSRAVADVLRHCPEAAVKYIDHGYSIGSKRGLLVLSANRGLAGGFNSNIIRFTEQSLEEKPAAYIIILGAACRAHFLQKGFPVDGEYDQPLDPPTMFTARELAEKVTGMFERGELDSFDIIHTRYKSAIKMSIAEKRLCPLNPAFFDEHSGDKSNYTFEPSPEHVLTSLVLKYLKGYLYGCLIHTWLCELTSRVAAMDSAIRNGNEMLDKLSLAYNRDRQAAITQEITEIVAGALALEGAEI